MAQIVTTIPQSVDPFNVITLEQVMAALPDTIPHLGTYGLCGKITEGKQTTNLIFQARQDDPVSSEVKAYFSGLITQATGGAFDATMNNAWRNNGLKIYWVYDAGEKILQNNLIYRRLPPAVDLPPEITWAMVLARLPQTIPYTTTLWATGGIVREGRSFNDFDIIAGAAVTDENGNAVLTEKIEVPVLLQMKKHIEEHINLGVTVFNRIHADIGNRIMTEREPVYLCKLYENGQLVAGGL